MNCNNNDKYHTTEEWQNKCVLEFKTSLKQQELSQKLVCEARHLVDQTKELTVKNKRETDHQTKVKVNDLDYKCDEMEKKINHLEEEVQLLSNYQIRIVNANKLFLGDSLDVIAECLRLRKCRKGIDLVFDDVEKELLKERELILGIQDEMEDLLDKVISQMKKLRPFMYFFSEDLRLKKHTLQIETHNEGLDEKSFDEFSVPHIKNVFKPATISMVEWDHYTSSMLTEADKILVDGKLIREYFDKCLSTFIKDLIDQSDAVDEAIKLRVEEYREIIEKLHKQKSETNENIAIVEKTIDDLFKAVNDKQPNKALAGTRLVNRTRREGIENCRDDIEVQLENEVMQLDSTEQHIRKMIQESITCARRLKQVSTRTDIQLEMKNNTLHIDGVLCFNQRKRISYRSF